MAASGRHLIKTSLTIAILLVFTISPAFADKGAKAAENGKPAVTAGPGAGEIVDKTGSLKEDFHPKLKRLLSVKDEAEIQFLKELSEEEQIKLADLIQRGIESESSKLLERIAFTSNFFPAYLLAKFSPMAGAEMAARLSAYVPQKRAIKIAKHTDRKFLAETAYFLQPAKVVSLMEATPDKLLIEVADIIIKKGDYYLLAEFADHLSVEKAKSLVYSMDKAEVMLHVAYYMKNTKLLGDTIKALPAEHVSRLIKEVIDLGYFEMSAKLSQRLDADQIVMMLDKVDPAYVASIAIHYPPELTLGIMARLSDDNLKEISVKLSQRMTADQIARMLSQADPDYIIRVAAQYPPEYALEVMDKIGESHIQEIAAKLTGEKCAAFMNQMPPAYVNHFWNKFPQEVAIKSLPFVDLNRLKSVWGELSPEVRSYIQKLSPNHQPLADMLKSI